MRVPLAYYLQELKTDTKERNGKHFGYRVSKQFLNPLDFVKKLDEFWFEAICEPNGKLQRKKG